MSPSPLKSAASVPPISAANHDDTNDATSAGVNTPSPFQSACHQHVAGIPSTLMSRLNPDAMSQESGTPLPLQSSASPAAMSQESGTPLPLQSGASPIAISQESGTRFALQSAASPSPVS